MRVTLSYSKPEQVDVSIDAPDELMSLLLALTKLIEAQTETTRRGQGFVPFRENYSVGDDQQSAERRRRNALQPSPGFVPFTNKP